MEKQLSLRPFMRIFKDPNVYMWGVDWYRQRVSGMMTHLITSYLVPIGNILPAFSMIVCIGIAKEIKKVTSFSMRWYHYLVPANRMRPPLGCGLTSYFNLYYVGFTRFDWSPGDRLHDSLAIQNSATNIDMLESKVNALPKRIKSR